MRNLLLKTVTLIISMIFLTVPILGTENTFANANPLNKSFAEISLKNSILLAKGHIKATPKSSDKESSKQSRCS